MAALYAHPLKDEAVWTDLESLSLMRPERCIGVGTSSSLLIIQALSKSSDRTARTPGGEEKSGIDRRYLARDLAPRVALARLRVFQSPRKPASVVFGTAGPPRLHKSSHPTVYYPGARVSPARQTSTASTLHLKAKPPAAAYRHTNRSNKALHNQLQPQKQTKPAQHPQPQHPSK